MSRNTSLEGVSMRSFLSFSGITGALLAMVAVGCGSSDSAIDPALLAEHQARLVLAEEPDGVLTVLDVREALLGESVEVHDHDHAEHADDEHAGHDDDSADDDHADDEHAGHDDDEHAGEEHADDEHAGHDDEEHAGHDHSDHAEDEHAHEDAEVVEVEPAGPIDVLIVGTVGGLTNPWEETQPDFPFAKNQATFFLADSAEVAALEEEGHVHAPGEECAFCAAHAADRSEMLAMVNFVDENNKIVPIGVPQMFDVKVQDTVVIQGKARIVAGGMMIVEATGIYVRR
jgi:hypothetical protein